MAQDVGQGFGAIDPFGQFIALAYLKGLVPGSQTSAYNTVLDLLSPGAVAGRQEAGVPNVAEQFENMFGGVNLTNQQISQMQQQGAGLRTTPGQELEAKVEMDKATREYLLGLTKAEYEREVGMAGVDIQKENLALTRELLPGQLAKQEADIAQANSLASYYDRQGKPRPDDPQVQQAEQMTNIRSLAIYGQPWDFTTGKPAQGVEVDPESIQAARAMLGMVQSQPNMASVINTMMSHKDQHIQDAGQLLFSMQTGIQFKQEERKFMGLIPYQTTVLDTGGLGGVNDDAVRAEIARLETYLHGSANPEGILSQLSVLHNRLGEPMPDYRAQMQQPQ
jgi:hypothetical protein